MTRYLLAGGGTAGHVNPLLALADEIMKDSSNFVIALGTKEGLEANLVPQRGYELLTVPKLPMPRRPNFYALKFPFLFRTSVNQVKAYLREFKIDVVVGFGGYASAPAYRAAKQMNIPYVVHEANVKPGYANRVGAREAAAVGVAFRNTRLPNQKFVGMPLRREIVAITESDKTKEALDFFDLDLTSPTLLVTGGSLGAKRINDTIESSRAALEAAGVQVIHIVGDRAGLEPISAGGYRRLSYCERMDLAIAAADLAIARAGAATVSEFAAVGLPAIFVPYSVGNGEQKLNALELVSVGASLIVDDPSFTVDYVKNSVIPLISNKRALSEMKSRTLEKGTANGAGALLKLVNSVLLNAPSNNDNETNRKA